MNSYLQQQTINDIFLYTVLHRMSAPARKSAPPPISKRGRSFEEIMDRWGAHLENTF